MHVAADEEGINQWHGECTALSVLLAAANGRLNWVGGPWDIGQALLCLHPSHQWAKKGSGRICCV